MSFNTDGLLTTLSTPRPKLHVITTDREDGYIYTVCACGQGKQSLGYDESSKRASAYWALEHQKENGK